MTTCPHCPDENHVRNIALDALGCIAASERGDLASVAVMVNSVMLAGELQEFTVALVGHAGSLLRLASHESGLSPDKICGAVSASMREGAR